MNYVRRDRISRWKRRTAHTRRERAGVPGPRRMQENRRERCWVIRGCSVSLRVIPPRGETVSGLHLPNKAAPAQREPAGSGERRERLSALLLVWQADVSRDEVTVT